MHASDRLKDDTEIVTTAMAKWVDAIKVASARVQEELSEEGANAMET